MTPPGDGWDQWRDAMDRRMDSQDRKLDGIYDAVLGPMDHGESTGLKASVADHGRRLNILEQGRSGIRQGIWSALMVLLGSLGSFLAYHLGRH